MKEELLQLIHKNAAMGVSTIPQAMSLPQSRAMTDTLSRQLTEYRSIVAQAQLYAREHGTKLKPPGPVNHAMTGLMLRAQSAIDPSTSRLAESMIRGSTMGTVQITRHLHRYVCSSGDPLLALGQKLLQTEERNIQQLKRFL